VVPDKQELLVHKPNARATWRHRCLAAQRLRVLLDRAGPLLQFLRITVLVSNLPIPQLLFSEIIICLSAETGFSSEVLITTLAEC
jgi:hypothetical protein